MALLAGVGVTWYTWLEQGREINASTQVLDAVATTLRLDRVEREHLYRLAEATPLRTECSRQAIPDTIREIVHSLDPLPASLINSRFDHLLSNNASEDLFWDWHSLPCIHKNTLWCCVTEPAARGHLVEYDAHIRYLVARLRSAYSRHIGDPDWEEDLRRLASLSREFAELWARTKSPMPSLVRSPTCTRTPGRCAWPSASWRCRKCPTRASSCTRRGTRTPGPGCR